MFLLMGSHLFDPKLLEGFRDETIVMIEDYGLCTHFRFHKLKILFFLEAMRNYRDLLKKLGFKLSYHEIKPSSKSENFTERFSKIITSHNVSVVTSFSIEDIFFREQLSALLAHLKVHWVVIESPMFLNSEAMIKDALPIKHPFMRTFYESERKRRNILLDAHLKPLGGKFSFDHENRLKLPKAIDVPAPLVMKKSPHSDDLLRIVRDLFSDHPGETEQGWLPVTRHQAQLWLQDFLHHRLSNFGLYEDAINPEYIFIFHSALSPLLNCGLLTPAEVLDQALIYAEKKNILINSIEGFVRQIMGWREFIRGIYEKFSLQELESNFFNHYRKLSSSWYDGTTGLLPLDDAIKKVQRFGYCHHIERLMILSNAMLLCEIHPKEVYRWFMEMFIDSADWVMVPNVFGMGQFSDGGLFAVKPYICGSNYILKMSSYKKDNWCDILDGLYWRFINRHRDFFRGQPRLAMMPKLLDRMAKKRLTLIFSKAEDFILKNTL